MNPIKVQLVVLIKTKLQTQIETAESAVAAAIESKNSETKSSAGDKFETGRAMMQIEQEKHEGQLALAHNQLQFVNRIDLNGLIDTVQLGSLVLTDQLNYFISIGHGKLILDNQKYYAISVDSPIGRLLIGKSKKEHITFRDKQINILDIQ